MQPSSLSRNISPPPRRKGSIANGTTKTCDPPARALTKGPSLAAIEAGEVYIRDHLDYFSHHLRAVSRGSPSDVPRLSIFDYQSLYKRNQDPHGHHFVVHQHDHPISGVHYDLRLQFSETSTASFAIPYGLPGNPNSIRPNRMAIETRVHNLWNNLIESASHATGSLLIWDTGEYDILPYHDKPEAHTTDDELSEEEVTEVNNSSENELFRSAFQDKRVRIRLRGKRLPPDYTISLRLTSANDRKYQPNAPRRKRRRTERPKMTSGKPTTITTDSEDDTEATDKEFQVQEAAADAEAAVASEDDEDARIRTNNAYTGATNTIGSIHQRHWFLSLDKKNSGFHRSSAGRWIGSWDAFFVMGRDMERSVVTGRNADEVMSDGGVKAFIGRKMWRPIIE